MFLQIGFLIALSEIQGSVGFSYENPEDWGKEYPTCDGKSQSPIDLKINFRASVEDSLLKFNEYNSIPDSMKAVNNGHSIQISGTWSDESRRPYLSGGPLTSDYVFEQFHFHWGNNDSVGSEHTLRGQRTSLELHMVHWKRDYGSFSKAAEEPDGVAVVGALYDATSSKNTPGIRNVWKDLKSLTEDDTSIQLKPFPLSEFEVVESTDIFVSYYGSLTTPGCNEVVTWLIALELFTVGEEEMQKIRTVHLHDGDTDNWRPLQDRNGRDLTYYETCT